MRPLKRRITTRTTIKIASAPPKANPKAARFIDGELWLPDASRVGATNGVGDGIKVGVATTSGFGVDVGRGVSAGENVGRVAGKVIFRLVLNNSYGNPLLDSCVILPE